MPPLCAGSSLTTSLLRNDEGALPADEEAEDESWLPLDEPDDAASSADALEIESPWLASAAPVSCFAVRRDLTLWRRACRDDFSVPLLIVMRCLFSKEDDFLRSPGDSGSRRRPTLAPTFSLRLF